MMAVTLISTPSVTGEIKWSERPETISKNCSSGLQIQNMFIKIIVYFVNDFHVTARVKYIKISTQPCSVLIPAGQDLPRPIFQGQFTKAKMQAKAIQTKQVHLLSRTFTLGLPASAFTTHHHHNLHTSASRHLVIRTIMHKMPGPSVQMSRHISHSKYPTAVQVLAAISIPRWHLTMVLSWKLHCPGFSDSVQSLPQQNT